MTSLVASIFNDVIGPVMRGPSSSHSAASVRIGRLLHDLVGGVPETLKVEFDKMGSLATTHEGQGTDMGLFAGVLGWDADDQRLPTSADALNEAGCDVSIELSDVRDPHPNTYRLWVQRGDRQHEVTALSTGGGIIEVVAIDGRTVRLFGDSHVGVVYTDGSVASGEVMAALPGAYGVNVCGDIVLVNSGQPVDLDAVATLGGVLDVRSLRPVLPVLSSPTMSVPFDHASDLDATVVETHSLDELAITYERARGLLSEDEVMDQARYILNIMRHSVQVGLAGTQYDDRILGHQSGQFAAMRQQGALLDGGVLNRMIEYVTALMEAKSAMEVIVAAPTAGACATFPGALLATVDDLESTEEEAAQALLAGGLVGVFITNKSSFAAEVGGCQAETGAGAAMAAAALVTLAGGSAARALSAASQALQNVLGLICDPVANRVEAPCLGRNVSGAANALSCANMALAGYDHLIPFDEVLDAHRQVSELMARELRCTGLGGLAMTATAQRIELDLHRHRT